jgi:hypothetical protein
MMELARTALAAGVPVIVDAVFSKPAERQVVERIAQTLGVRFDGIWLEAPAPVLEARLQSRKGDASDADVHVLKQQMGYDLGDMTWTRVDVSGDQEDVERRVWAGLAD